MARDNFKTKTFKGWIGYVFREASKASKRNEVNSYGCSRSEFKNKVVF